MSVTAARPLEINPWLRMGPCSPDACVEAPAAAVGHVHRVARLLATFLVLLAGLSISLAACRARTAWRAEITKMWARLLLRALGIRVETAADVAFSAEVAPVAQGEGALLVANHISWLDPLVMAATVPSRPLAKREIGEWPLIRTLAAGSGALFIDRERLSALPSAVATVANALRAGDTVVAFPEGTTWCGRGMGEFRPAVFQAAIDAGAAVRPAALRYREGESTSTRGCYVGDDSLLASLLRVTATRGLVVEVTLFAPVRLAPTGRRHEARTALARIAEAHVRSGAVERVAVDARVRTGVVEERDGRAGFPAALALTGPATCHSRSAIMQVER
ncbi:1-acyl-sn-glycerol-3-phosphate acyltransferase [Nonomuraea sp. NEAU-A123]|uniref:lysophospholipid acyltransferase family protein n=1 Tax=Nonomuraea sp. NEAU-A123 TaxID=2839649 RepID=UPI001BE3DED2|nr:lysophospholipid acyltransferase family protein [Nonomuraea sp. NEAU-A123]MBT2226488.1 1-acyl-sn-glycerol-3-phosphate acyltransferase [Nonomuraea sp. NEAU-A123]